MSAAQTLSIIACGKVGQTLARLWVQSQTIQLQDILNTSVESGSRAATFIGAGRVARDYADLQAADIFLIGAPDDQIAACCAALAASGRLSAQSIVFHCSGALSASILTSASLQGAAVASIHPIRSFAVPEQVVTSFAGTYCGIEGEQRALEVLKPLFVAIGAQTVEIESSAKVLYHAGAVFASNYLVTLLDTAVQSYGQAGIAQDVALKMMASLVRETTENVLRIGPEQALTGPIARNDIATVIRQYRAVNEWDTRYGKLYKQMGKLTAQLARRRNKK
ncbi:Rossmann-like domain protein [compost metagenome]